MYGKNKIVWSILAVSNRLLWFRSNCLYAVSYLPLQLVQDEELNSNLIYYHNDETNNDNILPRRTVLLFNILNDKPSIYLLINQKLLNYEVELLYKTTAF